MHRRCTGPAARPRPHRAGAAQAGGLLGYIDALSGGSISRVGVFSLGAPRPARPLGLTGGRTLDRRDVTYEAVFLWRRAPAGHAGAPCARWGCDSGRGRCASRRASLAPGPRAEGCGRAGSTARRPGCAAQQPSARAAARRHCPVHQRLHRAAAAVVGFPVAEEDAARGRHAGGSPPLP